MKKTALVIAIIVVLLGAFGLVACSEKNATGAFYSLQNAFDNGWLTKENLQSIAYYHNDSMPVYLEPLIDDIAEKIEQDFVKHVNCIDNEHNIRIQYYGSYNHCVAMMIVGCLNYAQVVGVEIVGDVVFSYADANRILLWRNNKQGE